MSLRGGGRSFPSSSFVELGFASGFRRFRFDFGYVFFTRSSKNVIIIDDVMSGKLFYTYFRFLTVLEEWMKRFFFQVTNCNSLSLG